jgi:predicted nucleic acid-binding protein
VGVGAILDTNVVSEMARQRVDPGVQAWLGKQELGSLYLSVVSAGEMEKGFTKMSDIQRRARLEAWLADQLRTVFRGRVLPVTHAIAKRWGSFDGTREMAGRPLSAPDGMIAATAFEYNLTVVTRNVKDVEGLGVRILNPWEVVSGTAQY